MINHRRNELIVAVISNVCLVSSMKYGVLEQEGIQTERCDFAGFEVDVGTVAQTEPSMVPEAGQRLRNVGS